MSFMSVQNVAGALVSPKNITKKIYEPYLMRQMIFFSSPFAIRGCNQNFK